ncbi:unnamed protein product [Cuscuta epithymum]|nr:unnamed protein product [Cuscuta epithymum]
MQVYLSFIANCCCVVGLFGSGEWRSLKGEMNGFGKGKVSYVMTLVWIALSWQMDGVKFIALLLALWGFLSYLYQHHLDDSKPPSVVYRERMTKLLFIFYTK